MIPSSPSRSWFSSVWLQGGTGKSDFPDHCRKVAIKRTAVFFKNQIGVGVMFSKTEGLLFGRGGGGEMVHGNQFRGEKKQVQRSPGLTADEMCLFCFHLRLPSSCLPKGHCDKNKAQQNKITSLEGKPSLPADFPCFCLYRNVAFLGPCLSHLFLLLSCLGRRLIKGERSNLKMMPKPVF